MIKHDRVEFRELHPHKKLIEEELTTSQDTDLVVFVCVQRNGYIRIKDECLCTENWGLDRVENATSIAIDLLE